MTRIAIGSDGYQLKEQVAEHLREVGHEVEVTDLERQDA